ncbi:MAG: 5-guanidino-2-oxopentanoate decarboxylase [Pseudomonadota bacterium]
MSTAATMTCGMAVTHCLELAGVTHVFGIPGNHTLELYRGLDNSAIRHITTRHEQGAGFMADGYARASGRPGVCYFISGPGLLNAATALGQARGDSVPLLIISAVAARAALGQGQGQLHELPDQQAAARSFCRASYQVLEAEQLVPTLHRAWTALLGERPGPIHIELPLDVMELPFDSAWLQHADWPPAAPAELPAAALATLDVMADALHAAERPLLLLGGGAQAAGSEALTHLAERLDAPVINTVNAKGLVSSGHPLSVGSSPSAPAVRELVTGSDLVLAIGTEFGETDYDLLLGGPFDVPGRLLRIDIDAAQLERNQHAAISLAADARLAVPVLLARLGPQRRDRSGVDHAAASRAAAQREPHRHPEFERFFKLLNSSQPDAVIVGDSTRPTYYATWQLETKAPRRYFHSASGFGTLGYALPAALGAGLGTDAPVIALIGDGGIQFTLPELGTGADAGLAATIVIWCNRGYEEIENSLAARGVSDQSTAISAPNFEQVAAAYGLEVYTPNNWHELEAVLAEAPQRARARQQPNLILMQQTHFITQPSGRWYS